MSTNVDQTIAMKERNYKQVQQVRQANARERKRLDNKLNSPHGIVAVHKYHLAQVEYEQVKLKKELLAMTSVTANTGGVLPPRKTAKEAPHDLQQILLRLGITPSIEHHRQPTRRRVTVPQGSDGDNGAEDIMSVRTEPIPTRRNSEKTWDVKNARSGVYNRLVRRDSDSTSATRLLSHRKDQTSPSQLKQASTRRVSFVEAAGGPQKDRICRNSVSGEFTRAERKSEALPPIVETSKDIHSLDSPGDARRKSVVGKTEQSRTRKKSVFSAPNGEVLDSGRRKSVMSMEGPVRKKSVKLNSEEADEVFSKYNPDGTLRTEFMLPSLEESITEAMKARYVRCRDKREFERELDLAEIFADLPSLPDKLPDTFAPSLELEESNISNTHVTSEILNT